MHNFRVMAADITSRRKDYEDEIIKCNSNLNHDFQVKIFKGFIYLVLESGEGKEKQERKTSVCGCLLHTLYWGPGLQPRHVPLLGIEQVTL